MTSALAFAVTLLQSALALLMFVGQHPELPQSVRDQANQTAQQAITQTTQALGNVGTKTSPSMCPSYMTPGPDWCSDGTIVPGGTNANGCQLPPTCVSKSCPAWTPPSPDFCSGGTIVSGGMDANGCQLPPSCVPKISTSTISFRAEPNSGNAPLNVTFYAGMGEITQCTVQPPYSIDFGDGSQGTLSPNWLGYAQTSGNSSGATYACGGYFIRHSYASAGTYKAVLSITEYNQCVGSTATACAAWFSRKVTAGNTTVTVTGSQTSSPSITNLSPRSGPVGTQVTITGTGFTPTGNNIAFQGQVVSTNLSSTNGTSIRFTVPAAFPVNGGGCVTNGDVQACYAMDPMVIPPGQYTVLVSNANGTSSPVTFTVTSGTCPMYKTPVCPSGTVLMGGIDANGCKLPGTCTPINPVVPSITNLSPSSGPIGTQVTITGTGFTPTGNNIAFQGQVVSTNLSSTNGTSIRFTVPAAFPVNGGGCVTNGDVQACYAMDPMVIPPGQYTVLVSNANGTSSPVTFTVTMRNTCPAYMAPTCADGTTPPPRIDANGCQLPGICNNVVPICPPIFAIDCLPGYYPVPGGVDANGCQLPGTCTPYTPPVTCTMEVKICPDGSYVGRVVPTCAFAPCPGSDTANTYSTGVVRGASTMCLALPYNMHRGDDSVNSTLLQDFLRSKGYFTEASTGFYGDLTVAAVKLYQGSKGLPQTGMVYDFTRAAIKADTCGG